MPLPKLDTDDLIDEAFTHVLADTVNSISAHQAVVNGGVSGTSAETVLGTLIVPAQPAATIQIVSGFYSGNGAAGDRWFARIRDNNIAGTTRGGVAATFSVSGDRIPFTIGMGLPRAVAANTAATYVYTLQRADGAGNIAEGFAGRLSALVLPA